MKMKCSDVEKLLSEYLDNSLDMPERQQVKMHLDVCVKCTDSLKAMVKVDNLLKLKTREKPSKEYFKNYWPKLERKLMEHSIVDRPMISQRSGKQRWANLFIPKFSPVFSAVLIVILIFVNSLLYIQIQQITSLQAIITERQEEMQKEISRYLTKTNNRVILPKS